MEILRAFVHYGFHFLFPGIVAYFFYRKNWKAVWGILVLTIAVDLDHLFAEQIFEANRCSINFHPLHTYYAIGFYAIFFFIPKTRVVALGLLMHMATDFQDCLWMQ